MNNLEIDFTKEVFPKSVMVTEQEVDLSNLTKDQRLFYSDLLKEVLHLYEENKEERMIVGFAGPSGAGKSTCVEILKVLTETLSLSYNMMTLGIDAYSFRNEYLESHSDASGDMLSLHKGRFDTYDISKLEKDLLLFKEGKSLSLPSYSRKIHEPVEDATTIMESPCILLVEGLWLLREEDSWANIGKKIDFCFFMEPDKELVRELTIRRHMAGGRTLEEAILHYTNVDAVNYDRVMLTAKNADKIIPIFTEV